MDTSTAVDICPECIKFWTAECCPHEKNPARDAGKKEKTGRTLKVLMCSDFKAFPEDKGD